MTPLFSSTIKVDCPDGPRYILKHPEKAFAITFPDWEVRVTALVKFYGGSEARVDPKVLKKTKSIVKNLTENYAALQSHYQAAYLGWCGNPCSKEAEKAYNEAKALICEKDFALKELENNTSKIADTIEKKLKERPKKGKPVKMAKRKAKKRAKMEGGGGFYVHPPLVPIPETMLEEIQEIVSKLKI